MSTQTLVALTGAFFGAVYGVVLIVDAYRDHKFATNADSVELTKMRLAAEAATFGVHVLFLIAIALLSIRVFSSLRGYWSVLIAAIPWVLVFSSAYSYSKKNRLLSPSHSQKDTTD